MQVLGSPASIVASVREEAEAEVERIRESTGVELASILAEETSFHASILDREERLNAERHAAEERIARQEWEGRRAVIEQREQWIQEVVAVAQERWKDGSADRRAMQLRALIQEALSRMPQGAADVAVSARDLRLVDVPAIRVTTAAIDGGCIVTAGDVSFDNSFEARSRRFEPEWRNALSGMYSP